jgi:hypothetical protein
MIEQLKQVATMLSRERGLTRERSVTSQNILTYKTHSCQNAGNVHVAGLSSHFKAFYSPPHITCVLDTVLCMICKTHSVYFSSKLQNFFVMEKLCAVREVRFELLWAFAKFRKVATSFVLSVRLPHRIEQLGSHWTDFSKTLYLNIFRNSA